ncbi:VanZ family protein [Bacillus sp. D386]|uniref:VanZ family protein n=1 Tax=Bacillus sp. D386 TaxID=2587155 RepID=UPI00111FA273|nr:VanZ family protein [Bacillus sp. D386]
MNNARKKIIYRLILLLLVVGVVFYSSSQPYTEQNIQPLLSENLKLPDSIVALLSKISFTYAGVEISVEALGLPGFIEFFIRKGAHFSVYFVMAFILASIVRVWVQRAVKVTAITLGIVFLYACSDEWHQSFTGDRTPLFHDVMIDTVGGLTGIVLYFVWRKYRKPH